jgi:exopolyphosphatase/guanosine-5'-triphosphate,3'-diphosphate pyrophosphatase
LKDQCGRDFTALERETEGAVALFGDVPVDTEFYAIGGTATTIAAQALGLETYESDKVTGAVITAKELRVLAEKFKEKSVEEIAKLPCMPKGREDVITGGIVWMLTMMEKLGIDRIIASDKDNLEGYAIKRGLME